MSAPHRFFTPEDTSPRWVKWHDLPGGFVIAALPINCRPVLILVGVEDDLMEPAALSALIRWAVDCGSPPARDLAGIFVYQIEAGRNAPVTRLITNSQGVVMRQEHPMIAEEEFVQEQARMAGALD